MAWIYIVIAGLLEVVWAVGFKYANGFTRLNTPTIVTLLAMFLSFAFLSQGVRSVPIGTAYAVWTGIGATGAALYGIVRLGEPLTAARVVCLLLIIGGIVGLKVLSPE